MPQSQYIYTSLERGEVTPKLRGRVDSDQYESFLETLENCYVEKRGGVVKRPGSEFIAHTKSTGNVRVIPFIFSETESYVMEFGHYYVRFYSDGKQVSNVGDVKTYLGNGTSDNFVFPYESVSTGDIEVTVDGVVQTDPADYSIVTIDPATDYFPDFDDAGWNLDAESSGSPWVLNVDAVTSPGTSDPLLLYTNAALPLGGLFTIGVDITAATFTQNTISDTDATDQAMVAGFTQVASVAITESVEDPITFDYTFVADDPGQTSNFWWELRRGAAVIHAGSQANIGAPTTITYTGISVSNLLIGEDISLYVRAETNGGASTPQVSGTVTPTLITSTYTIDTEAKLGFAVQNANQTAPATLTIEPTVGTVTLIDMDAELLAPAPFNFAFRAEKGLEVTLQTPTMFFKQTGHVIQFTTPPPTNAIVLIRDKSVDPAAQNILATTPFEIQSPFSEDQIDSLYYAQANDQMWFAHHEHAPWVLGRYGLQDWRWSQDTYNGLPWYEPKQFFTGNGSTSLIWYNRYDVDADNIAIYNMPGDVLVDPSEYTVDKDTLPHWQITFNSAPANGQEFYVTDSTWNYPSVINGYPGVVVFFQERLWFMSTYEHPQRMWASRAADFYEFRVPAGDSEDPVVADSPLEYTIAAYTHEAIQWASSERVLLIGTSSTEHRFAPDEFLSTGRLPSISKMTDFGGAHSIPVHMGNMTAYIQATGTQLRSYQQRADTLIELYESLDLGWLCEHIFESGIFEPHYALVPNALTVMCRNDGLMLCATYDPTSAASSGQSLSIGWARWITDGEYHSDTVIPRGAKDEIWVVVRREIEGQVQQNIELFDSTFLTDSSFYYSGDAVSEIDNLTWLEGRTIQITTESGAHEDRTVLNGRIILDGGHTTVAGGIGYNAKVVTMPFEGGNPAGTSQGKRKRHSQIWVSMVKSAAPLVNGRQIGVRKVTTPMDTPEPYTTEAFRYYNLGWDREGKITIEQPRALPMHIVAIYGDINVGQGA